MAKARKISFFSLGCFRNRYDSEVVAGRMVLGRKNLILPDEITKKNSCDVLVVNTCGFIDPAKIESIQTIQEAVELKRAEKVKEIYVFGCLVERFGKELKKHFPEVDKWWGVENFSFSSPFRLAAEGPVDFIKICEGCINRCSYCAIPLIKGPLKSRPAGQILKEVEARDKARVKELNIIGQDITSWGKDFKKEKSLAWLIRRILKKTKEIDWIRLVYLHPRHLSDELIELIAGEKRICNYIDLPIQHINQRILKLMGRETTPGQIKALIKKIRKKIPECVIRTSIITGFPTETESEFKELLFFIKEVKFERMGVFIYSREEGTKAAKLSGQVHHMTKKKRRRRLMEAQQQISAQWLKKFCGKKISVLVEEKKAGFYIGRSQLDAPEVDGAVIIEREKLKVGKIYQLKVTGSLEYDLIAQ